MNARQHSRFEFFLIARSLAALVNILSRIWLNWIMPYEAAILASYLCGMTTAYLLNKRFVFDASGRDISSEYARFALVNLFAAAQVWLVSVGLVRLVFPTIEFTWNTETVAHIIGLIIPVFTSYLGTDTFPLREAKAAFEAYNARQKRIATAIPSARLTPSRSAKITGSSSRTARWLKSQMRISQSVSKAGIA